MTQIPIEYVVSVKGAGTAAAGLKPVATALERGGKAGDKFTTSARGVSKASAEVGKSNARLATSLRGVQNASTAALGPIGGVGTRLQALASVVGGVGIAGVGIIAGFAGLALAIKSSVGAADEANRSFARIDAIIRSTGGSAGITRRELGQMAIDIGRNTLASVKDVRAAGAQLLTFRSIGQDAFGRTLELAQDLSAAGFGGLSENAVRLGRALEDPEQGLTALRRVGVSVSDSQRELVLSLQRTGQAAEAQKVILDILAGQVGGTARAESQNSLAGAADTAAENFGLLLERIGNASGVIPGAITFFQNLGKAIEEALPSEESLGGQLSRITGEIERLERRAGSTRTPALRLSLQRDLNAALQRRLEIEKEIAIEAAADVKAAESQKVLQDEKAVSRAAQLEDELGLEASRQRQLTILEQDLVFLRESGKISEERLAAIEAAGRASLADPAIEAREKAAAAAATAAAVKLQRDQEAGAKTIAALTRDIELRRLDAQEPLQADIAALQDQIELVRQLNVAEGEREAQQRAITSLQAEQVDKAEQLIDARNRSGQGQADVQSGLARLQRFDPSGADDLAARFNEALANADSEAQRAEIAESFAKQIGDKLEEESNRVGQAIGDAIGGALASAIQGGSVAQAGIGLGAGIGQEFAASVGGTQGTILGAGVTAAAQLGSAFLSGPQSDSSSTSRGGARSLVDSVETVRGVIAGGGSSLARFDRDLGKAIDPLEALTRRVVSELQAINSNTRGGGGAASATPAVVLADSSEALI